MAGATFPAATQAATYAVSNEAELRNAITAANSDGAASSTIEFSNDIEIADASALPAITKALVIDTGAFRLQPATAAGDTPGMDLALGNSDLLTLRGTIHGGDASSTNTSTNGPAGGAGLAASASNITNEASVTGGAGGSRWYRNRVVGGAGGAGMSLSGTELTNAAGGAIVGGAGGNIDVNGAATAGGNSGSGTGGTGLEMTGGQLINQGAITGGAGGNMLNSPANGDNQFAAAGGTGAVLTGGAGHVNAGTIVGGQGGIGQNAGGSGHGAGGTGVIMTDTSMVNQAGASIAGVDGRTGGGTSTGAGSPGGGGAVLMRSTLENHGTVIGGNSGATAGAGGGIAIRGTDATVVNGGAVTAGLNGNGTRAVAILFEGGTNTLELRAGSSITGIAQAASAADTLALGGTVDDAFDVSQIAGTGQYRGFGVYDKTGSATWTLTGTTATTTSWNLLEGTLSVAGDANLGAAPGTLNFDGGTLQVTGTSFTSMARDIDWGENGGGFDIVDGGNVFTVSQALSGPGGLTKDGAGTLVLTADNSYTGVTAIDAGTLQLGDAGTTGSIAGNVMNDGVLDIKRSDTVTFGGTISGSGSLVQSGIGATILTADNSYSGVTDIQQGTLVVDGNQAAATGAVDVAGGATLAGSGTLGGAVTVASGGTIAPGYGSVGTLTTGALTLQAGSRLSFELGARNVVGGTLNDLIVANGDVSLGGALEVALSPGGRFDPGVYRLIDYGGMFTGGTLTVDSVPPGSNTADVFVQTQVAQQVNLVHTGGLNLRFWDGPDPAGHHNGAFEGADGVWQNGGDISWTDADPATNGLWSDNAFAVFGGMAGDVAVDNGAGPVNLAGAQFLVDGYTIAGPGSLTTTTAETVIRVGDGTAAGLSMAARIDAPITGAGGLVKSEVGTLVLGGDNSYQGGTTIAAGTLQVAQDRNLGAPSGGLALDGGTLRLSQDFDTARAVAIQAGGGGIDTQGFAAVMSGELSGSGDWAKLGSGTLTLSGSNSSTGTATVSAGTLRAGASNAWGSAASYRVAAGAVLDAGGFDQTIAGVTNGGTVNLLGTAPGATLTVQGDYAGSDGRLRMGTALNGDDSATDRLVIDGGTVSGQTAIEVVNVGGLGAQTTGNGIELVRALNGATTTAQTTRDAFSLLGEHVDAGAFEYRLLPGNANGDGESWYLRSTLGSTPGDGGGGDGGEAPVTYRPDVALNAAIAAAMAQNDLSMLGTLHRRIGDDVAADSLAGDNGRRAWSRVITEKTAIRQDGTVSPESRTYATGAQLGTDLLRLGNDRVGVYGGYLSWHSHVEGFASGLQDASAGTLRGHSNYAGAYWTHAGRSGWYSDLVVQQAWQRGSTSSHAGTGNDIRGESTLVSLELGKPLKLGGKWSIEPQAQVIASWSDFDGQSIPNAQLRYDNGTALTTRLGLRLNGHYAVRGGTLLPYGRINLWHGASGTDTMTVGGPAGRVDIDTQRGYTSGEIAVGATWSVNQRVSLYGEFGRTVSLDSGRAQEVDGAYAASLGMRYVW